MTGVIERMIKYRNVPYIFTEGCCLVDNQELPFMSALDYLAKRDWELITIITKPAFKSADCTDNVGHWLLLKRVDGDS